MKKIILGFAAIFAAACLGQAAPGPELSIEKAAALAQKDLKDRGLDGRVFITSCALQANGVMNGERHWVAMYSEALAGDDQKKEVGLRINFDGTVVHLVQSPGDGEGLRNHFTRSDRPSILDLKR